MKQRVIVGLALAGVLLTAYMTVVHFTGAGVVCAVHNPKACDTVLSSTYSSFFGVPVALLGLLTYAGIAYFSRKNNHWASWLTIAGVFAAGFFNWVMFGVLDALCVWCETSHSLMSVLFFLAHPWRWRSLLFFGAVLAAGALAGVASGLVY